MMFRKLTSITDHNIKIFYFVDALRAMWFMTSVWVAYEKQYLTLPEITFIEACILGVTLLFQLPTGAFADIFGKTKALIIGNLLYFTAVLVYSFASTPLIFFLYAFIMGLASAFIDGTREALLYDTLKQDGHEEKFPYWASKLSMVFQISLSAATIIGGIVGTYSYVTAIRMSSVAFLAAAIMSSFYREPNIDTEKFSLQGYIRKTKQGIREIFKNPYVKKISIFYILIGFLSWTAVLTFNMMLLTEMRFTTMEIGIAVAVTRLFNSIVIFKLIGIASLFTRRNTFLFLPIFLIVTYFSSYIVSGWWVLVPVMGAMFISNARWNILSRYTNAEFESRSRATAISALCMAIGFLYVLLVGGSGWIIALLGSVKYVYTLLGFIACFTVLPLGMYLSRHEHRM